MTLRRPHKHIRGILHLQCTACPGWQPESAFYTYKQRGVVLPTSKCKACTMREKSARLAAKVKPPKARADRCGAYAFEAARIRYQQSVGNRTARVVLAHCPVQVKAPQGVFKPAVELEEA